MTPVIAWTTFERDEDENPALEYWLSRPPSERIEEVERLRREYFKILGVRADADPPRLQRILSFMDPETGETIPAPVKQRD